MIEHMVIERLIREEKIEAVVLGCTELPLMYADDKLPSRFLTLCNTILRESLSICLRSENVSDPEI